MRLPVPLLLTGCLAACGNDPAPATTPPSATSPSATSPSATPPAPAVSPTPARGSVEREVAAQVTAILDAAAAGTVDEQGRAPARLEALGDAAIPPLLTALVHAETKHRRLAAVTLLQLGEALHRRGDTADFATADFATADIATALRAASSDRDPAVAAAATHALRRITGDTTALDAGRAAHAAAERGR